MAAPLQVYIPNPANGPGPDENTPGPGGVAPRASTDLAKVKRNVSRMVEQNAPETDIDEYIKGEGVTLDQVRSFKAPKTAVTQDADQRQKLGAGGFLHRMVDNVTLGAANPIMAATSAAASTAGKALTGRPTDFAGDYTYERDVQDELLKRSRDETGWTGFAAEVGLSLPFMAGPKAANALAQAPSYGKQLVDASKMGAAYGGVYGLNSARGGVEEHISGGATGAIGGAFMAPLFKLGVDGAIGASRLPGKAYNWLTGRTPDQVAAVENRLSQFAENGVRAFGPAMTESPTQRRTAEGLAGSLFGAPLRNEAMGAIDDATLAVQRAVRSPIENMPVSDVGAELQGTLKRNLVQHSIPSNQLSARSTDELGAISGPLTDRGFQRPLPKVEPVQPRTIDPIAPARVDPNAVPFEPVLPRPVARGAPAPNSPRREDVSAPPEVVRAYEAAQREARLAQMEADAALDAYESAVRSAGLDLEKTSQWMSTPAGRGGYHPELVKLYNGVLAAQKKAEEVSRKENLAAGAVRVQGNRAWREAEREAQSRAAREAEERFAREQQDAAREAQEATAQARQRAIMQAEAEAQGKANAETARLRAEAQAEAERATKRAEMEARAKWEAESQEGVVFRPGASKESYPTEFSAAYEQLNRVTPTFRRNPIGEKFDKTKTSTENLMNDMALEMRARGELPGFKAGKLYGDSNVIPNPKFLENFRNLVGDEVAEKFETLMGRRAKAQFGFSPDGIRDLVTTVRRAKQAAQKPPYPGTPMPERAAALARLEGALKDDYHQFIRDTGPQGEHLVAVTKGIDQAYAAHLKDMRKPLSKLFGDNVTPVQAMDKLAKAATDGDLSLLRPFVRTMAEKDNPSKGVGAIIAHMTNNAASLQDFVKGYKSIHPDALPVLFQGEAGKSARKSLDQLADIAGRLAPFEKAVKSTGGVDLTNRANIYIGLSAVAHFVPALMASAGAVGAAKFMSSPKYVSWMTRVSRARTPAQLDLEYGRIAHILERDTTLGDAVKEHVLQSIKTASENRRKEPLPGMMKLGGPQETQGGKSKQGQPNYLDIIANAAQKRGIDPSSADPQAVIDAAWEANPSDAMADAIEMIATKYRLKTPWGASN